MAQPFALENLASKVGLSQKRAQQDYFNTKADEATELLKKELEKMHKKSQEKTGFFGKAFGKHAGIAKTLASIGLNAIPGVGTALAFGLNAADLAKSQSDMRGNIKDIGRAGVIPARFKGTFLENYLKGGVMGGASQLQTNLKSQKDMQAMIGLVSLGLQGMGSFGGDKIGKIVNPVGHGADVIPEEELLKSAATSTGITTYKDGVASLASGTGPTYNVPGFLKNLGSGAKQSMDVAGRGGGKLSQGIKGIASTAREAPVPFSAGLLKYSDLMDPLVEVGSDANFLQRLGSEATRGVNYAPLLEDLLQSYFTKPGGEPVMTEAQAPKFY